MKEKLTDTGTKQEVALPFGPFLQLECACFIVYLSQPSGSLLNGLTVVQVMPSRFRSVRAENAADGALPPSPSSRKRRLSQGGKRQGGCRA